ncbi:SDR family oxidoreductase [Amphritea sp. 1_MG-2023]|jgi:NAD(P)-dependent dehydrogenase (short-subunit alcohol dehydrogenase family)|uniref:SDR family oxidoreductase n=1 Tax=Amphritea sp. 1_MG-2023 TaxID=3062670 RepID=UPI0026E305AE|nr:SDR family oxidoreductase [Amphritea sp. 1_MG-2023]MDO6563544.1 SDR family oxidoreductase [Amphritea sp. 1_MG-2023]
MQISFAGKRVMITAGAAGMGRATAMAMHKLGATVFTCDVDEQGLASLPEGITTFVCDVSDSSAVNAMFDQILPGGLDIMVNNAGIGGPTKPVEDVTDDEWSQCMSVCIDSQFYCTRRVVPVFKANQSGVIINLVSAAGILGFPNRSPYVAAKWAVSGFTKSMAMELGQDNIRVNGIVPGNVNGERMERVILAHAEAEGIDPAEVRRLYAIGTSMQCYVDPEEIADTICFLCSDYGRHISGQIVGVDGFTETLYPRT